MTPRIDWTLLSNEWEKFWIAFRDEENKATVLNAFWNMRGGRGRYFYTGASGLEFPRGRYPVGDDGSESIYTVTPLDKLKGQPSSEPVKPPKEVERVTAIHILIEDGGRTVMLGENAKIISCMIPKDSSSHIKVWVQDDSGSALRNYKFTLLGELNVVPEGSYFVQTIVDKDDHPWHIYVQKLEA
ncbi:gp097 [Rhodococcus phage ReqiPepy6]|uniref:Gp097 n=1 Tax=Rhodococcus phage ReqiPepy6 TaxID=691965 RepID=D4P7K8_9CAUD|nr:gp097 [Rhodococcus phage ReqiPepy6]ADD80988.1 gp097 [Rhodococcus phage ReqiPepy6]